MTPTAPAPVPAAAAPASSGTSKGLLCGGIGCCAGILVVGLIVGGIFGYRWYRAQSHEKAEKGITTALPGAEPPAAPSDSAAQAQPGQPAADAAARACHPSYGGQLKWRSDDWKRVKLWMGPEGKELTTELILQWNDKTHAYEVERDAPIERPKKATPKPGEAAAKREALAKHPSWVAKIMYRSPDWTRVKVWIGPPASEFVSELVLQWNSSRGRYDVQRARAIPEEPVGPRPSRDGAIAAARSSAGPDGYAIYRVESHNGDWTRATILFGGEASEFDTYVTVQWTGSGYEVVDMGPLDTGSGDAAAWEEQQRGEGDPSDPNATEPPNSSDDGVG